MTNEELVKLIQSGDDVQGNLEKLWLQNTGIVHKLAVSYARNDFEVEDLEQEGYFALVRAAEKFDRDCGAKFTTYFFIHCNAQMRRYISKTRSSVSMAYNMADLVTKYFKIKKELQAKLGAEPSDKITALLMDISMKKLHEVQKAAEGLEALSLDDIRANEDQNLYGKIPDPEDKVEDLLDDIVSRQISEQLWKMVDELDPVEQEVIKDIYLRNKNGAEIGRERGLTRAGISRIKVKALKKLKQNPASEIIKVMARDIYGIALQGSGLATFQQTWTSSTERAAIRDLELSERASKRRDIDYE